jgi:quinol monooxygenase YgiN/ketosteroid isomerase-like protein
MPVTYFVRMRALPGNADRVRDLVMVNVERIQNGEPGNLAFAVHRSTDDPNEFWLYETWADAASVEAHESGQEFKDYKDALRPLVDPDSVVFGNCEPLAALGYSLGQDDGQESLARRFVRALGGRDAALLDAIYDPDVTLYTPLAWPIRGRDALKDFVEQFHVANPGLRVTLHDEFYSADGTRGCWRFVIHFHNTGPFYGNAPTGERGTMSETHAVRIRDGRIVEQFVGDNNFSMPHQELVSWKMDFPRETPDPLAPAIEASAAAMGDGARR